jgi:HEAT repeat protein
VAKFLAYILLLGALAIGATWYVVSTREPEPARDSAAVDDEWLEDLYSQNPKEAQQAERDVNTLGERALPVVRATLRSEGGDRARKKAALKACVLLEERAAPVIPEVATQLGNPELTEEAAVALSYMGRAAFGPLRKALTSADPLTRREAVRSIGKLKARAPLDSSAVLPLLIKTMADDDPGVRAVAATYIGIIHEGADASVPSLIAALEDPVIEVRRAAATALGSFGEAAEPARSALRKAAADADPDLAREAGRSLIKLQPPR